jgi:hypothetical protein
LGWHGEPGRKRLIESYKFNYIQLIFLRSMGFIVKEQTSQVNKKNGISLRKTIRDTAGKKSL